MRIATARKYKKNTDEISDVASVMNLYASKINYKYENIFPEKHFVLDYNNEMLNIAIQKLKFKVAKLYDMKSKFV